MNLGLEPYYRTEDGRDSKRFADAEMNRYRLYDFYRRQADFHRGQPAVDGTILPPFPGLDGGRRGHWAATNERATVALARTEAPEFTVATQRGGNGLLLIRQPEGDKKGWIVSDTAEASFHAMYPSGSLSIPDNMFAAKVDRFGFKVEITDRPLIEGVKPEWSRDGKNAAWNTGYHLHGNEVVLGMDLAGATVLDQGKLQRSDDGRFALLVREFEFTSALGQAVSQALPVPMGGWSEKPITTSSPTSPEGLVLIRQVAGNRILLHAISGLSSARGRLDPSGSHFIWESIPQGALIRTGSLVLSPGDLGAGEEWLTKELSADRPKPSSLTAGGPNHFSKPWVTHGRLNQDPAASGTAYEIDDIPLSYDHPERTPFTLSGLAFDDAGVAYMSTLVGDVWRVTGLHGDLREITWQRYAAGLDHPLGIEVVKGVPYVNVKNNIVSLRDLNGDGAADYYQRFNRVPLPSNVECGRDLRRDADGNFYFNTLGGIFKLSPDGMTLTKVGEGARNPLGLAVRGDGLVLSDSSEGTSENGTCSIYESAHPENAASVAKRKRLVYLPRGVDNSPGSRLFLDEPRFGPLGKSILGVSFGSGVWYSIQRDLVDGTAQGLVSLQPGLFSSGACRVAVQPLDGQVFVAGLDGWGDYAITEGCLHRIRYTGKPSTQITAWKAHRNGILIEFNKPLDPGSIRADRFFTQQWNYVDAIQSYGSPEYSAKFPDKIGHDRLIIDGVTLTNENRSVFISIRDLLPAMCTQIRGSFSAAGGQPVELDVYASLQKLAGDSPLGAASRGDQPTELAVVTKANNGDTNQTIVEHFDHLAGREAAIRPVTAEVQYKKEELDFDWVKTHLIGPNCLPCHGPGTQHDFSTRQGVLHKLRLDDPEKSVMHGLIQTGGMPPYPLPRISPSLSSALLAWIRLGAPE